MAAIRLPHPICLSLWAEKHYYLSPESSAIEGPWSAVAFQRGMLDLMACDDIRELDIEKCARIGYTKMLLALIAYEVSERKRATGVYQPTDGDSDEFAENEINPLLRDMPKLRDALDDRADPDKQGRFNKLSFKKFKGAPLYIRGGHAARSYRRLTLDTVIFDEIEGFEREIGEEGSPVYLGDGRISNSPFPKSLRGSTPGVADGSILKGEVEKAELRLTYRVPCPHCGTKQELKWSGMRWPSEGTNGERAAASYYQCVDCEGRIEYRQLPEMLEAGYWGSDKGHRVELHEYGPRLMLKGKRVDFPSHVAMHIWVAYSPFFSWERLVKEWLDAQGDYLKLKAFTNIRLGEYWEEEAEEIEPDDISQRAEPYVRPPARVLVITAGIDVQPDRIEMEIVGWGEHKESWSLDYRVFYGDTEQKPVWDDLDDALLETYPTEDGRKLQIAAAGLDTGFNTLHCYRYVLRTQHPRLFPMKGSSEVNAPIVGAPSRVRVSRNDSRKIPLFVIGVSVGKATIYRRLQIEEPLAGEKKPGFMHFPEMYGPAYYDGLTAEKKVTKKRKGFQVVEWVKIRDRNEPLDCRNYANAALEILNPTWSRLAEKAGSVPEPEAPEETFQGNRYKAKFHRRKKRNPVSYR